MKFDYSKLKGRIVEKCGTQQEFAAKMGWSERTTSLKLNNRVHWTQADISLAMRVLEIRAENLNDYFFTLKVQNVELS